MYSSKMLNEINSLEGIHESIRKAYDRPLTLSEKYFTHT
jgi:hypothetical protein